MRKHSVHTNGNDYEAIVSIEPLLKKTQRSLGYDVDRSSAVYMYKPTRR
jgi:hypothetical protein